MAKDNESKDIKVTKGIESMGDIEETKDIKGQAGFERL